MRSFAYRHAVRASYKSILGQLQSLSIPVSHIVYYLVDVGRMQSLERFRFAMDELGEYIDTLVSRAVWVVRGGIVEENGVVCLEACRAAQVGTQW